VRRKLTGLILLGLILVGCSEDKIPPPQVEVFLGELVVHEFLEDYPTWVRDTDQVVFTVEGGTYNLEHVTKKSDLCDSKGKAIGFGTNTLMLIPTYADGGNCDHLKVPQGEFKSVYRGDSLYLGPDTQMFSGQYPYTMIYEFQLTK